MKLGFPVLCIDRFTQIEPVLNEIKSWRPGEHFPNGVGAEIPDLDLVVLPENRGTDNQNEGPKNQ